QSGRRAEKISKEFYTLRSAHADKVWITPLGTPPDVHVIRVVLVPRRGISNVNNFGHVSSFPIDLKS
ncbi:hypothetical protein LCGC14_1422480, partial [marine sediment metagenome]